MKNSNPLMLLRIAQGDAYAMAAEYLKSPRDDALLEQILRFEAYQKHPTHTLRAGQYTDDGQMTVGVTEVLLGGRPFTPLSLADAWIRCYHRDPREGYARGFQGFLHRTFSGQEFLDNIHNGSEKNGGGMRIVPGGVLPDPQEVVAFARLQAAITHNTPLGLYAAEAVALLSHFALYTDLPFTAFRGTFGHLLEHPEWFPEEPVPMLRVNSSGAGIARNTIQGVYTALTLGDSLMAMLDLIIRAGGDTDTVAAITWGIASCRHPEEKLPEFFEVMLEPGGRYGVHFLRALGEALFSKAW